MNETNCSKFKKRAAAVAVASCLTILPFAAGAAGLGKLTVMSGLGQPLRAELDIAANRDELVGMTAKLAPQDAFRQAGIDYASALLDLRFSVEKKANGQSVVRVTSSRPVNEPFLDFLVELNWPTGRLVREYTFLLDPPEVAAKQAARPVVDAKIVDTVQGGGVPQERSVSAPVKAPPRPASAPKVASEPAKKNGESTRVVQPGDTLRKIAGETQYEGVSLEQMLVGLFRKNPDAFVASNINRLKAGAILDIPEKEAVEAVTPAEAKKVYVAQAADWNAYRQKLAATTAQAPAREEAGGQASSGKITAKLEEKAAPAEQSKDKVKVSPTEMAAKGAASAKAAADAEAERVAKDKSLKEAQDRLAILEKNVAELQKLVEMKNQKLAELQQQTAVKKEEAKPVEPPKPVEAPKPPEPVKAAEPPPPPKVAEEPKPAEPPKPVEEAPKPVEPPPPPVPVQPPAPPVPKPVEPPPPPPEEPGMLDALLEDPLPLAGGVAALALLGGYFVVRRRRESSTASQLTTTAPGPSSLGPNSVFRMTGGQSVDTGNTPPQTGDFSQTGPGTIDTDEVDPVAEADVYMAYGRDTQAEEILLEALQKDPHRTAIHAKLLEIYANRRSLKQFETLASELYAQTAGVGADWEKVAALGASLDPQNPLYTGTGKKSEAAAFDANATMVARPEDIGKSTLTMPAGALAQLAEIGEAAASAPEPAAQSSTEIAFDNDTLVLPEKAAEPAAAEPAAIAVEPELDPSADLTSLDFDLGADVVTEQAVPEPQVEETASPADELPADLGDALDFDLGGDTIVQVEPADVLKVEEAPDLSFDLDVPVQEQAVEAPPAVDDFADVGRDFSPEGTLVMPSSGDVGISTFVGGEEVPEAPVSASAGRDDEAVDFDFDLDSAATATSVNTVSEGSDGMETMVVAHGFDQMGDHEDSKLLDTLVETQVNSAALDADSLEFDVSLTDSVFLGQPMPTDFDIGSINLDLAAPPTAEAQVAEGSVAEAAVGEEASQPEVEPVAAESAARDAHWEEVNTKLDLAKAYEEMGDLEGARELLQEVVGEGSADLVEQAKTILGRIGE